ncbi:Glycoside hydrolase family 76 protein [Mycena venus]|uniref:Glycoside hydrolase family 76 protein n=1 Tax=Mycena venus TaxID=2733690 RepID=A0A8H7CTI6_9AGAR|nr:Glycoside hydrolase family 76 protein [Mycena venus]
MVSTLHFVGVALLMAIRGASQVASSSWRKPNITTPWTERVRLAGAALDAALDQLGADGIFTDDQDDNYAATGNLYSQLALFDLATNQTKCCTCISSAATHNADSLGESLTFGHAAAKAYAAYKKPSFLQYAIQSWWHGRKFTLSTQNIAARMFPGKNFTLSQECQNATMVGGTWFSIESDNFHVEDYATGYFMGLSALLAEITSDPMYLQAATESANFIHSHLYNVRGIVVPDISGSNNPLCEVLSGTEAYGSGLMIEGLAILFSITNDTSWRDLLDNLLTAAISNTAWHGQNGIVAVDGTGDTNLLQGLGAVYARNITTAMMHRYVGDYIAVQFNAVTDLATSNGTNVYAGSWSGPPSATFSAVNQTYALAALISALDVENDSAVSATAPTTSTKSSTSVVGLPPTESSQPPGHSTAPAPQKESSHLAAIIGGVLGGVVAVGLLLAALWRLRKRDSPTAKNSSRRPVNPFTAQVPSSGIPATPWRLEKLREQQNRPLPIEGDGQPAIAASASSLINSSSNNAESADDVRADIVRPAAVPTDPLVTVLNAWLQTRQWDGREAPPEYPVANASPQGPS